MHPGKFRIFRKRERYTVAIVEFLGYLHHGGEPRTMGGGKFLERLWLRKYRMWVPLEIMENVMD